MADLTQAPGGLRDTYMDMVRRKRMYSGLLIVIFVALMVSGFNLAAFRNAGGFWEGLPAFFDFPANVVLEAWDQRARLPEFFRRVHARVDRDDQYRGHGNADRRRRRRASVAFVDARACGVSPARAGLSAPCRTSCAPSPRS